jgi:hypothetical protein
MRWEEYAARTEEIRNSYEIVVEKNLKRRELGRPRHR